MPPEVKAQLKSPLTWMWLVPTLFALVVSLSAYSFLSTVEAAKKQIDTVNVTLTAKQVEMGKCIDDLAKTKLDKDQYYREHEDLKKTVERGFDSMSRDIKTLINMHMRERSK